MGPDSRLIQNFANLSQNRPLPNFAIPRKSLMATCFGSTTKRLVNYSPPNHKKITSIRPRKNPASFSRCRVFFFLFFSSIQLLEFFFFHCKAVFFCRKSAGFYFVDVLGQAV